MHRALNAAGRLQPYKTLSRNGATLRFYLGDCLDVFHALEPGQVSAVVTSPPYNLGVGYRSYRDRLPRQDYLQWTAKWVEAAARSLAPDGSLFLNVGAKPTDPWIPLDVAQVGAALLQAAEHDSLGQVDCDRPRGRRSGCRPRPRRRRRPLQADQQRAVRERLPRVHLSLLAGRTHAGSTGAPSGSPIRTRRTSTRWASAAAACDAAATPGSSPTRPSRAATRTARTRRPSRRRVPEQCLRLHGLVRGCGW